MKNPTSIEHWKLKDVVMVHKQSIWQNITLYKMVFAYKCFFSVYG